ncbi:MAG: hypothetical protein ACI4SQ_01880, partial [Eubacterium sp.]
HQGMICMPIPKNEPMPVTAVTDETAKMGEAEPAKESESIREEEKKEPEDEKEMVSSESEMETENEKKVYITDGKQSLGEVLMAHETTWEEFVQLNNLDQVALQEDQILYFTK